MSTFGSIYVIHTHTHLMTFVMGEMEVEGDTHIQKKKKAQRCDVAEVKRTIEKN